MKAVKNPPITRPDALRLIELLISRVLFWGALVSVAIAAAGLLMYVFAGGLAPNLADQLRHQTENRPTVFASVSQVVAALRNGSDPLALMGAGLTLLLMVPVLSVALLIPAFLRQGDYRYSLIATFVLAVLLFGLISGAA